VTAPGLPRTSRAASGTAWSGYADGLPHEPQRTRSPMITRQQKPITTSGTPLHGSGARARLAVNSRTRPDSARHIEDWPATVSVLVMDRFCWVAGQGFEPWKASADGFTVRSHMHFRRS
jgi:hypothetical protein